MLFGRSWCLTRTGIEVMGSANKNRDVPDVTSNPHNWYHDQDLWYLCRRAYFRGSTRGVILPSLGAGERLVYRLLRR